MSICQAFLYKDIFISLSFLSFFCVSNRALRSFSLDRVLAEYNKYATELNSNTDLIERNENHINEIDTQIQNIANAVAMSGQFNETLQAKLDSLETQKKKLNEIIALEKQSVCYLPATKEELRQAYKKAREMLEYGNFEEQKTVINMFLNKVVIFRKYAEIYINLIPISLLGGIDISITAQDILAEIYPNTSENSENTLINIEKDGIDPSSSNITLSSDILVGSPGRI